eukprot:CAMPEP_0181387316 /NCGR_PEP_ID=MMETSP1106-20121128/23646_1 /TAXON_ID=81844 /ORGANISM="Mantoniella antarctica, Strain SL-175" /LENGTH=39 /DNA_ID= /DNA_START= /DNA_END= /DNA_ORIENTATION=
MAAREVAAAAVVPSSGVFFPDGMDAARVVIGNLASPSNW